MRGLNLVLVGVVLVAACDSDSDPCDDFKPIAHTIETACTNPDPADPSTLVTCAKGAGYMGSWAVDADGLPAFDFQIDQRCDEAALTRTSGGEIQADPIHLIGNGRGLVAMAHASGGVEIYSQDRGHKWINHVDTWEDPDNGDFPQQLGGGFNYLVVDDKVLSTRFEDNSVARALGRQTRRFGVGYFETVTTFDDVRITRRVFAPDSNARALVAEVKLENLSPDYINVGLVEFWDLNQYQVTAQAKSSDLGEESLSESIRRARRDRNNDFKQTLSYSRQTQIALAQTEAKALPTDIVDTSSPSKIDYFPADVYLATLDSGGLPDAVWLSDDELWRASKTTRPPPSNAKKEGDGETRMLELDGGEQAGLLAMRVQVSVPTGAPVVRRFALGYTSGGVDAQTAVTELRAKHGELAAEASESWKDRLAWVAVDAEDAGVVQREIAWSSYYTQAHATFDAVRGARFIGRGGASQYVAGLDAAAADLSLHAEGLIHIDPKLAKENLLYALTSQHGSASETPWRFPYATTGVDDFSDGENNGQRSDAYMLIPSAVARYVALSRDFEFLTAKAPYWPVGQGELGSVLDHLSRSLEYANDTLGFGARGLVSMGTGDFSEGLLAEATETATPAGSSSVFNAAISTFGFPLLVDLVAENQPELADAYSTFLNNQADALENQAFDGERYHRAFVDSGNPLAEGELFLSTQILPMLAGMTDDTRTGELLDLIASNLETPAGAVSRAARGSSERSNTIVPSLNAWLTAAYALRDPAEAWQSLLRNTLATRADLYPNRGYGAWTGPESILADDAEAPGEAPVTETLASADYPALSSQAHLAPLRALISLLGVEADTTTWRVAPRMPSETFSVVLPRLSLRGTPTSLDGAIVASGDGLLNMVVTLPSGAAEAGLSVKVHGAAVEFDRGDDNTVLFELPARKDQSVEWSVSAL